MKKCIYHKKKKITQAGLRPVLGACNRAKPDMAACRHYINQVSAISKCSLQGHMASLGKKPGKAEAQNEA
ncbi:MAG: hypothetical protein IJU79_03315 [Desulfovibrionaceae bacterium]|nr:hypothetical protein [Desulfovibrionaceae bacterium]